MLASSVAVSLLLVELEALLALDAEDASVSLVAVELLSADRPCRKLTFSNWKNAGGADAVSVAVPVMLSLSLSLLLDAELAELELAAWLACCRCICSCCHC
jgi:hypothetical protein